MKVDDFIAEFERRTNPLSGKDYRVWDDRALIQLIPRTNHVELNFFEAIEPATGDGTKAIRWLKDLTNQFNTPLTGVAEPHNDNGISDVDELMSWYSYHGAEDEGDYIFTFYPKG